MFIAWITNQNVQCRCRRYLPEWAAIVHERRTPYSEATEDRRKLLVPWNLMHRYRIHITFVYLAVCRIDFRTFSPLHQKKGNSGTERAFRASLPLRSLSSINHSPSIKLAYYRKASYIINGRNVFALANCLHIPFWNSCTWACVFNSRFVPLQLDHTNCGWCIKQTI